MKLGKPLGIVGGLFSAIIIATPNWAVQNASAVAPQLPASPVSLNGLLQVLLGLAIVLAAVAGSAWLLRRFAPGQSGAGGAIKIVGGVMVGPKERVVVIEVGETWLLLGVASGQVNTLHSMARPQDTENFSPASVNNGRFAIWLKQAMHKERNV